METRIEKYRFYRNEIINESLLLDKIVNESAIISEYKQRIDEISPKILANLKSNQSYIKLISINNSDEYKSLQAMESYMDLIEEKKLALLKSEIDEWNSKSNNFMSLDSKGQISKKWLETDPNYSKYIVVKDNLENVKNEWSDFQITGKQNIEIFNQLTQNDGSNEILANIKTIVPHLEIKSKNKKNLYLVIIGISVVAILIFLIFLSLEIVNL
ncbi:MAG: hypothetical protein LBT77_02110 [Mycoplasmataceae bacterium]|nr:hypothetical protein [Mycoplasmataceae bacterium]